MEKMEKTCRHPQVSIVISMCSADYFDLSFYFPLNIFWIFTVQYNETSFLLGRELVMVRERISI